MMTPAASVSFFRSEFNDFLYAPISADRNEMPLSVLSALARLDVDPWAEAAKLSELPTDTATQRLASLIVRLPGGRWAQADAHSIANRLIELLPRGGSSKVPSAQRAHGLREMIDSPGAIALICVVLAAMTLIIAASLEPSAWGGHIEMPAFSTRLPSEAQ